MLLIKKAIVVGAAAALACKINIEFIYVSPEYLICAAFFAGVTIRAASGYHAARVYATAKGFPSHFADPAQRA